MATNALANSWVTFSKTRIIVYFSNFLTWFSHTSLMEINSTRVYFRSNNVLLWWYQVRQEMQTVSPLGYEQYMQEQKKQHLHHHQDCFWFFERSWRDFFMKLPIELLSLFVLYLFEAYKSKTMVYRNKKSV